MKKIGWFSNWFSFDPIRDSAIPKNIRETLTVRDLLEKYNIIWLGTNPNPPAVSHKNAESFGGLLKNIPKYNAEEWGTSANYVRDITVNYELFAGRKLPECDAVVIRALPSFLYENLKIYILLYQYGMRNTPVFIRDLELVMVKKFIDNEGGSIDKPFGISGSDKAFSEEDWKVMNSDVTFINPIGRVGNKLLKQWAPHLKFKTFYFPYDWHLYPPMRPGVSRRMVTYVGNDTGRRGAFLKYLKGLPNGYAHVYGGQARQIGKSEKNFPKNFRDKFPGVIFHGAVDHRMVNKIYNGSSVCMNLPKPIFGKVGFVSARFMEAAFSGAVLVLPNDFLGANKWVCCDNCIVESSEQLADIAQRFAVDVKYKAKVLKLQRHMLIDKCGSEKNIDNVFGDI